MCVAFDLRKLTLWRDVKLASSPFNLLRWFSLVSLAIVGTVAIGLGIISTQFVVKESIERDAMLTAQFVRAIGDTEIRHHQLDGLLMADVVDPRNDNKFLPVVAEERQRARSEFFDHISNLPDSLLANIYALDHVIVWSSNAELIGKTIDNEDINKAFATRESVVSSYSHVGDGHLEHQFPHTPNEFFIENYVPMLSKDGSVAAMVEIYKEPKDLITRMQRGYRVIWISTAIGGALLYFGLFWIVRRAATLLETQQQQLISNESFVALGEMSSALAHSLRNPLATIRSSAELAQEMSDGKPPRHLADIIGQVDRMTNWVRDLLISSRPLSGEIEVVDPAAVLNDCIGSFELQLRQANIQVEIIIESSVNVVSHRMMLRQVLNSLISNAIEAMLRGGTLQARVEVVEMGKRLMLTIIDSGKGMSRQQELMAFKLFYTTKQGGLGVGLVMAKRIMERFGGKIALSSKEHQGTTVVLDFKVAPQSLLHPVRRIEATTV